MSAPSGANAAESATLAPPAAGEKRVVFMGDSITDFRGRRYGKFFAGQPYINRGMGGQVTPQMLRRFRQDVIPLQPKVVVILAGTNDIGGGLGPVPAETTHANLMSMADLARAHGIRVVLSSMTPVCDCLSPQTGRRPKGKLKQLNDWLKEYATQNVIVYLDYWTAMLDEHGPGVHGHPGDRGPGRQISQGQSVERGGEVSWAGVCSKADAHGAAIDFGTRAVKHVARQRSLDLLEEFVLFAPDMFRQQRAELLQQVGRRGRSQLRNHRLDRAMVLQQSGDDRHGPALRKQDLLFDLEVIRQLQFVPVDRAPRHLCHRFRGGILGQRAPRQHAQR